MQPYERYWATENQFPYHVSVIPRAPQNNRTLICSGSVVAKKWVLTTATCVLQSTEVEIRFASVNHYTGGTFLISRETYIHPFYNAETRSNNVALIQTPISAGTVIALAPANWNLTARFSTLSGWGELYEGPSPVLQYAYGEIAESDRKSCRYKYGDLLINGMCVVIDGRMADLGSPLTVSEKRINYLAGIASVPGDLTLYNNEPHALFVILTRSIRDWITELTGIKS